MEKLECKIEDTTNIDVEIVDCIRLSATTKTKNGELHYIGHMLYNDTHNENNCIIHYLFVEEKYRNLGVGTKLVTCLKNLLDTTCITVPSETDLSDKFYLKNGFQVISKIGRQGGYNNLRWKYIKEEECKKDDENRY